ncbi:MAG: 4'-phosphopantetheinyl transferase superfamily protein [Thermodesulfobacteriota bacterium]|nr:4'-phosphopantetheinyl transferase superfamily protein [Thermodesulfobacteriota bacterium]
MLYMSRPIHFAATRRKGLWGLCRIDRERQYEDFLTGYEKTEYAVMKTAGRKREWLGARIALKKMLMDQNLIDSPMDCQTEKDRYGRPHLSIYKKGISIILNCSISHKNGLAAICIGCLPETRVGIDIEAISERPWRVRRAFINGSDSLAGIEELKENYTILWACKEAASKVMGRGMLMDFRKLTVKGDPQGRFTVLENGRETIEGDYFFSEDFIIAVCYRSERPVICDFTQKK